MPEENAIGHSRTVIRNPYPLSAKDFDWRWSGNCNQIPAHATDH